MRNFYVVAASAALALLFAACSGAVSDPSPSTIIRPDAIVGPTRDAASPSTSPSPTSSAAPLDPADAKAAVGAASRAYAKALFVATNKARIAASQPALVWNACAAEQASARVAEAIEVAGLAIKTVDHTCTERRVGEDMARNFGSADAMFAAWMDNVDLQQNIVRPEYTQAGVGCIAYDAANESQPALTPADVGGYVCSEVFLRVVP